MGCIVNGPGEAREADIGIAGGDGEGLLFKKGEIIMKLPEEKLVEPEPYVAIPAIQQISYCQNSDELRKLYANLLVASMNVDTKWAVHPSYVDIIRQLNPDEAKYIRLLPDQISIPHPLIDINYSIGEAKGTNPIIANPSTP